MKALPRRKGNAVGAGGALRLIDRLNESPSQKEGKSFGDALNSRCAVMPR